MCTASRYCFMTAVLSGVGRPAGRLPLPSLRTAQARIDTAAGRFSEPRLLQPGFRRGGIEEFHGIAGRIFHQHLLSTRPGDDLVAEPSAPGAQPIDSPGHVADLD